MGGAGEGFSADHQFQTKTDFSVRALVIVLGCR